ncbi:MAG: FAD-dependent oxidoreductase, partial [Bifidobacteriaceae bacterium]|nr:FAD-dependent oxidoreductase [Bifidobacteriaceae bacterium]
MSESQDGKFALSRRQFMGFGSAAAAVTVASMSGCSPAEAPSENGSTVGAEVECPGVGSSAWIGQDPEIAEADISDTVNTDVIVVGCGIAGSVAAAAALDSGASVTVLDKGVTNHIGGPACSMLNSKFQLDQGLDQYDPIQMLYELVRQSNFTANTSLLALWAFHSGEILDWLIEHVIKPDPTGGGQLDKPVYVTAFREQSPDPEICLFRNTGVYFGTQDVPSNMGDWLTLLHHFITANGGDIRFQMKVVKILQDDTGTVVGVIAQGADGKYTRYIAAKGVVMASGSFGSNSEMCNTFLKPKIARMFSTNNIGGVFMPEAPAEPLDNGEGHQMMCRIGAAMEQYPNPHNEYAQAIIMGVPFLAVNHAGLRFVNEAQSMLCYADLLCDQPGDDMTYWAIIPDDYATSGIGSTNVAVDEAGDPVNPFSDEQYQLLQDGPKADSIEELAEVIGVAPDVLTATVDRYNELCAAGLDEDFGKLAKYMKP